MDLKKKNFNKTTQKHILFYCNSIFSTAEIEIFAIIVTLFVETVND